MAPPSPLDPDDDDLDPMDDRESGEEDMDADTDPAMGGDMDDS